MVNSRDPASLVLSEGAERYSNMLKDSPYFFAFWALVSYFNVSYNVSHTGRHMCHGSSGPFIHQCLHLVDDTSYTCSNLNWKGIWHLRPDKKKIIIPLRTIPGPAGYPPSPPSRTSGGESFAIYTPPWEPRSSNSAVLSVKAVTRLPTSRQGHSAEERAGKEISVWTPLENAICQTPPTPED